MLKNLCLTLSVLLVVITCSAKPMDEIELLISKMSVKEKVGQLFVVRPDALQSKIKPEEVMFHDNQGLTEITDDVKKFYEKFPVGGVVLFPKNIESPKQLRTFTEEIHHLGKIKPFIYIDEEGGPVSRLANHSAFALPRFRSMQDIGRTEDTRLAFIAGKSIGEYLTEFSIDVDFAPVADVNSNPDNPIIGPRAFSEDPEIAAKMSVSLLQGLESNGKVLGCMKHYPGHGDTNTDTHKTYTKSDKTWDELKECELIPFVEGINSGVNYIMVGHINYPNVTGDLLPASLSPYLLKEKLRNELGFKGLIISDAMCMDAIKNYYKEEEACVMALNAGVDLLLMPYDFEKSFNAVQKAVKSKKIAPDELNQKLYRILSLKAKMNQN